MNCYILVKPHMKKFEYPIYKPNTFYINAHVWIFKKTLRNKFIIDLERNQWYISHFSISENKIPDICNLRDEVYLSWWFLWVQSIASQVSARSHGGKAWWMQVSHSCSQEAEMGERSQKKNTLLQVSPGDTSLLIRAIPKPDSVM